MIVVDMDMPKNCENCLFNSKDPIEYCCVASNGIPVRYGYDIKTKPDWCPIKCGIEDIKQKIIQMNSLDYVEPISCEEVIDIIDECVGNINGIT